MKLNRRHKLHRIKHAGFTLIESLMAIGFISVALTAMLEMNHSLKAYDAQSHQRFVNALTLENITDHLRTLDHAERITQAAGIATSHGATALVSHFEFDSRQGVQVTLSVGEGSSRKVSQFWSFDSAE